jgi:protein-L-isoaspartate O-methyltransferase
MNFQRLAIGLSIGLGVASIGTAYIHHRDFQADAQATPAATQTPVPERTPDVPYVPTPEPVVARMLQIAKVNRNDVVYDLGSGDGRIPITAVQKYGVRRAVGVDIDPALVSKARQNAQQAKVSDRVEFRQQDLFNTDLRQASVVTLYLLPIWASGSRSELKL